MILIVSLSLYISFISNDDDWMICGLNASQKNRHWNRRRKEIFFVSKKKVFLSDKFSNHNSTSWPKQNNNICLERDDLKQWNFFLWLLKLNSIHNTYRLPCRCDLFPFTNSFSQHRSWNKIPWFNWNLIRYPLFHCLFWFVLSVVVVWFFFQSGFICLAKKNNFLFWKFHMFTFLACFRTKKTKQSFRYRCCIIISSIL